MMRFPQLVIALMAILLFTGWGVRDHEPEWPHSGPMPDDAVKVKPLQYESITKGAQSYRPIPPMPWGDVNRRVAPAGSLPGAPPAPPAKKGSAAPTPAQTATPVAPLQAAPMPTQTVPPAVPMNQGAHGGQPPAKQ